MSEEEFEERVAFMAKVVPMDDIYVFAQTMVHNCSVLMAALECWTNVESLTDTFPQVELAMSNLLEYDMRFKNKIHRPLTIKRVSFEEIDED